MPPRIEQVRRATWLSHHAIHRAINDSPLRTAKPTGPRGPADVEACIGAEGAGRSDQRRPTREPRPASLCALRQHAI